MTFDLEKTIQYWHEGAKYDLKEVFNKPLPFYI